MKAYASRSEHMNDAEDLLNEARKRISQNIRSKITGGDVL
jgi:hypothetical protein